MRVLSAPVMASSIVLAGWLGSAAAQNVTPGAAASRRVHPAARRDDTGLTHDGIRQPTAEAPGLVAGISLGEMYTNNVELAGPGQSRQPSWITTIQPFIRAGYNGPRLSGQLYYRLTGYLYAGEVHTGQLAQQLRANGTLTLVPNHLFIDATTLYGREVIDNRQPSAHSTAFLDNNHANVATASISPYWVQGLGRAGTLTLRYTHGRVVYDRRGIRQAPGTSGTNPLARIPDISSDAVRFDIVSPKQEPWGWNLGYSEQVLRSGTNPDLKFATARLGASRQVGIHVRVLANIGKENKYLSDGTVDMLGAGFWNVGIEWTNSRNHFKLQGGHRFYGHSARFLWAHTAARLTTTLRYEEYPTDLNQQLLGRNPATTLAPSAFTSGIPSLFERRIYLMKRAMASASYEMPRSQLTISLQNESRDYFLRGSGNEKIASGQGSWQFSLGPFTTLTPTVGWRRYRFRDGQTTYTRYGQLSLIHHFNRKNFGTLQLRNDSSNTYTPQPGASDYRVNVIYLKWTHLF